MTNGLVARLDKGITTRRFDDNHAEGSQLAVAFSDRSYQDACTRGTPCYRNIVSVLRTPF